MANESHNDCVVMGLSAPSCEQHLCHLVYFTDPRRRTNDHVLCSSTALQWLEMAHEHNCLSNGEHVDFGLDFCYKSFVYEAGKSLNMGWGHANRTFLPLNN